MKEVCTHCGQSMRPFLALTLMLLVAASLRAQDPAVTSRQIVCFGTILDGDTIPMFKLQEVVVKEAWSLLTAKEIKQNQKLIRNVKKMLPYAKEGKRRLDILEQQCAEVTAKQRKELIKQAEKDLLSDYSDELKKCTFAQGKVLLKMVDRETGSTSYVLVNELRGKLRASFYSTFARLFGYNLKAHYDPVHNKEDSLIERIIQSVEAGKL